jgi:hypothetical protein
MTTHFFGFFLPAVEILPMPAGHTLGSTELRWRFPVQSFENAIELRKRLKSRGECDFADAQIALVKQLARSLEPDTRNILDKIYARYLLEIFA